MSYQNNPSKRVLEPYGIIHHAGRWFVVGHCRLRQELRVFRLDRVSAPVLLDNGLPFSRTQRHTEVWLGMCPDG